MKEIHILFTRENTWMLSWTYWRKNQNKPPPPPKKNQTPPNKTPQTNRIIKYPGTDWCEEATGKMPSGLDVFLGHFSLLDREHSVPPCPEEVF